MRVTTDKSEAVGFHFEHSAKHLAQDGFLMELECEGFHEGFQARVAILDGLWSVFIYDSLLREVGYLCAPD
tara:strand:- start:236 stop:448 length:213 start_codon:yes stop_codon:yes gene_type:complete